MPEFDISSINPFGNINLGGSMGTFGQIALVIGIVVLILGLMGFGFYIMIVRKQYWIRIHVFRLIGNVPTRVAVYSAKEVPFGYAGDKLWKVAPAGFNKLKIVKWLPVGKIQTAPREFWYYVRKDGEWINFRLADLDKISEDMGIRFVQEDMRLQRLATERLLEQRLLNKTFWEKWGNMIMTLVLFLVIGVCMVIIFYQWGKLIDKMIPMVDILSKSLMRVEDTCGYYNYSGGGNTGLIPV